MAIKRALLSVSDKTGLVELAQVLHDLGVELVSTGGTARALAAAGLAVRSIDDLTGFPEMMDGRVKTLHPRVHGGLLNRRDNPSDRKAMQENGIVDIDLVVVNLYPFLQTVSKPGVTWAEAIENIDIGGPSMVRSAAKNNAFVTIVVDPADYPALIVALQQNGDTTAEQRKAYALKAFRHTAAYDSVISNWIGDTLGEGVLSFPTEMAFAAEYQQALRYGENPHQKAALYRQPLYQGASILKAMQLQGKELSFNNLNDSNAALELILELKDGPAAIALKHATPCGAAYGNSLADAFQHCYDADPISIFGGIVALNRVVDQATAKLLAKIFLEVIIAPDFDEEARRILAKKPNLRLLVLGNDFNLPVSAAEYSMKQIRGGYLFQAADQMPIDPSTWELTCGAAPTAEQIKDLSLAWTVVKHARSNAIVVVKNGMTLGIGGGQVNRIDAARHAVKMAGSQCKGAVMASDAFFPFTDSIEAAKEGGIAIVIEPSGAQHQSEVVEAAAQAGITVMLTKERHFRH